VVNGYTRQHQHAMHGAIFGKFAPFAVQISIFAVTQSILLNNLKQD